MAVGRPSDFKEHYVEEAEQFARYGLTEAQIADRFDVSEQTLNAWKHRYPAFLESLKRGKENADNHVVRSLYERALGYSHEDTFFSQYKGEIVSQTYIKHYPPDPTSCIFWLKNRRPDQWREKTEVSISLVAGIPNNTLEALKKLAVSQVIEVEEVAQVEDAKE